MLDSQHRGNWLVACDKEGCPAQFELGGFWDITPSKQNTISVARQRKWYIGKEEQFCSLHRPYPKKRQRQEENISDQRRAIDRWTRARDQYLGQD
jgi:hypothetical protein